jgi:ABC-type multidrug transport system permease subunit
VTKAVVSNLKGEVYERYMISMIKIAGLWVGITAIVVGILIILLPDLIRWILGIAFIVTGVMAVVAALKK